MEKEAEEIRDKLEEIAKLFPSLKRDYKKLLLDTTVFLIVLFKFMKKEVFGDEIITKLKLR